MTPAQAAETEAPQSPRPRLLAVDDDPLTTKLLRMVFEQQGYDVYSAETGLEALELAERHAPGVAIVDLRLPDLDGLALLERLRALPRPPVVIMLTAHGEVSTAVRAMQLGARHYLTKPVNREELLITVRRALEHGSLVSEVQDLRRRARPGLTLAEQMGPGAEVAQMAEQVTLVATSDLTVLIQGETGSGKELIAQAIHRESDRAGRPFIAVDCGAIPETLLESELFGHEKGAFTGAEKKRLGQFQLAEGGTLFLDEIGNLPAALHAKLLRALESREVAPVGGTRKTALDIRFVAATNVDLRERVRDGSFREDLYFRLAQYTISLPALRERTGDIPHLARRFQAEACREMRRPVVDITPEALTVLQGHAWPGNVRELRNVVRQAVLHSSNMVISADVIRRVMRTPEERPVPAGGGAAEGRSLRDVAEQAVRDAESAAIRAALRAAGGNKAAAAKALRTDYKTLHLKLQRYGIKPAEYRKDE